MGGMLRNSMEHWPQPRNGSQSVATWLFTW